MLQKTKLKDVS